MRWASVAVLAVALAAALAPSAQAAPRTVRGELTALRDAGLIDPATHDRHRATYDDAVATRGRLRGARRVALGAVLDNLASIAARGQLGPSRLPALMETVARNRAWWATGPLLRDRQRVTVPGSRLVWEHYAGQGLQIQWLGTFGKANGLFQIGTRDAELRALLDEALALAAQRAGGVAFEYLFRFNGGRPPWVSALAQGTGIQALSRAAVRLNETRYFEGARAALGVFRTPPPQGVRVGTPAGAHYLIYSYAPGLRVLNGFVQSLNGLHEFGLLANDAEGRALFAAGDAQLRAELAGYDTGGWSRYSRRRDSDLNYHRLVRDFLRNLCGRLEADRGRPGGGASAGADPAPYCAAARRFTADLTRPPRLGLVTRRARARRTVALTFTLDKPAFVALTVLRSGRAVATLRARVDSGRRSLRWAGTRRTGTYAVVVRATDLAGNHGAAGGELRVLAARRGAG